MSSLIRKPVYFQQIPEDWQRLGCGKFYILSAPWRHGGGVLLAHVVAADGAFYAFAKCYEGAVHGMSWTQALTTLTKLAEVTVQ
jgi:hypothetical protein